MTIGLESQLLWGSNYENVVEFSYPRVLDGLRHWRRPAPDSRRERTPAGTVSSWITGRDYYMAGRARWFRSPLWSGGPGLQEFMDWSGEGNVFRFRPDKNVPDFYVDSCVLDEPFENPEPQLEQADGSQAVDLVIRNPSFDFGLALRGLMFEYAPGTSLTDPVAATFARATAATYRGVPLPVSLASPLGASAASGMLRDRHYEGSTRTTLLEGARTQLLTNPENFGAWGLAGTPIRTSGQADPFGGTAAYLLEDNDAAAIEYLIHSLAGGTFTGDGTKCFSVFMKKGTSNDSFLGWWDDTAGVARRQLRVDWDSAGVPTLVGTGGSGTLFSPENWGAGWWRISFAADGVIAANAGHMQVGCTQAVAADIGTTYIFGANAWNETFPSSYQGPSLGTRNADAFTWPHAHKPQGVFFYYKGIWRNVPLLYARFINIGSFGTTRLLLYGDTTNILMTFSTGGGAGVVTSTIAISPLAYGDTFEVFGFMQSDGKVKVARSINGGVESAGTLSGALALPATYATPTLAVGSEGGGGNDVQAVAQVKVGPQTWGGVTRDTIQKARDA